MHFFKKGKSELISHFFIIQQFSKYAVFVLLLLELFFVSVLSDF